MHCIQIFMIRYMMKLRHGANFGSPTGTSWRLLFIFAMMPWMRKHRRSDESFDISKFKFAATRMWTGRMPLSARRNISVPIGYRALSGVNDSFTKVRHKSDVEVLRQKNEMMAKELIRLETENEILRCTLFQGMDKSKKGERTSSSPDSIARSCPPMFDNNFNFYTWATSFIRTYATNRPTPLIN